MLHIGDIRVVSEARVMGGKVHVLADPKAVQAGLHVRIADTRLPLLQSGHQHAPEPLFRQALVSMLGRFGGAPKADDLPKTEVADATVTNLASGDWVLEGETSTMVVFNKTADTLTVPVTRPVTLPSSIADPVELTVLLAAHRCHCSLIVRVAAPSGGGVVETPIAIDVACIGGKFEAGYQKVRLRLDDVVAGSEVSLALRFERWKKDAKKELLAIAFIARARLEEVSTSGEAGGPGEPHYLVSPVRFDGTPGLGHQWFETDLPVGRGPVGGVLALSDGTHETILMEMPEAQITITRDEGHTVVLRASRALDCLLMLNHTPVMRLALAVGETHVRLPTAWLTGEYTHFCLRDRSDSVTLLQTVVLPPRALTPADVMLKESRAPYPTNLFAASGFRYAALRAHSATPVAGLDTTQLAWAVTVLEGGYDKVKLRPLTFPVVEKPDVSIVIPAHNKVSVTYSCLCALLLAWNKASFEIILVDDASTDETATLETMVSGITVVRNTEPQRFIRACNAGAALARGEFVVMLNNDTEPTTGWLDTLIDAFSRFRNVGLAGSKLLFPNGRLQDAGGIIWGTGNPWNYGSKANPWEPKYCYARQADYLSGAALMTRRSIWEKVGGFSSYLEPMYFEDTDLSFKIRDHGYTTWFVPSSIVFHHEGMTSGTDTASGFKRFQEVNRPKFKRRWARAFGSFGEDGKNPDLEKDRGIVGRVLFIDYTTPRPDHDAGSYAALQEIKLVQALGYKVTFLPENLAHFGDYTTALEKQGVEVIAAPFVLSTEEYIAKHCRDFDAIYITRYHVANNALPKIRAANPRARIILNNADLHFLRQMRAAHADGDAAKMIDAERVRDLELAAMRSVDLVLSYNDIEHAVIQSHTRNEVRVMKCPWVVDVPASVPPRKGRAGLSFLGSFAHFPNVDGVKWLAREVMPLIADVLPEAELSIYGSNMGDQVKALASVNIRPVGFVTEVEDAFNPHLIFVAPLLSGAGIKGKVLAAMSHGIPCILSPFAAEGIGLRNGHDCLIVKTPRDWAEAIHLLHKDTKLWQRLADNARVYMKESCSFERGLDEMRAAFEAMDMYGSVQ